MGHTIYDPEGSIMNIYNLIAAFEDAVLDHDSQDNEESLEAYNAAREALANAIAENNPAKEEE